MWQLQEPGCCGRAKAQWMGRLYSRASLASGDRSTCACRNSEPRPRDARPPPPPHRFVWEGEGGSSRVLVLSELRCSKKFSLPLPRGRALGVPERRPGAAPRGGTRRQNSGSAARPSLRPPLVSQVPRSEDFQPCPPLQLGLPAEVLLRWAFVNPRPRQVSKA